LRELQPNDVNALAAIFADDEVMRWIGEGSALDREGRHPHDRA
jgi:hypothetical protein